VSIRIIGGGPAGSAAAIAALRETSSVHLYEKSRFPRHKVCGEFFSSEIAPLLESLGLWQEFLELRPAPLRKVVLHFGNRTSQSRLPDEAYGLSRYEFDRLLFERAVQNGATAMRQRVDPLDLWRNASSSGREVRAIGRQSRASPSSERLFGFKAHFEGAVNDAVDLFFFRRCYVGVSAIENGITNICGIAPEADLRSYDFQIDDLLAGWPPLARRVESLSRTFRWITVGPLVLGGRWKQLSGRSIYPAGDALGFVDPFLGLGLITAVGTGRLAGLAASRQRPVEEHLSQCRRALRPAASVATILRLILGAGLASSFGPLISGRLLFQMTRPGLFAY